MKGTPAVPMAILIAVLALLVLWIASQPPRAIEGPASPQVATLPPVDPMLACQALAAYGAAVAQGRDLGKSREETDAYALDRLTDEARAALQSRTTGRRKFLASIYASNLPAAAVRELAFDTCPRPGR